MYCDGVAIRSHCQENHVIVLLEIMHSIMAWHKHLTVTDNRLDNFDSHRSVNACLAPVVSLHGQAVTTVEGIGSSKTRLHPVQVEMC